MRRNVSQDIDAYSLLIEAICHQAAKDIKSNDDRLVEDAKAFFRSKWFEHLTDLDSEDILERLLDQGGSK